MSDVRGGLSSAADRCEMQVLAVEPRLNGFAGQGGRDRFENPKYTGNRNQFRVKFLTEHPRAELTTRAGHCASAQRAVDVDAAVRDDLGTGTDSGGDDEITIARVDSLAGPHGLLLNHRRNAHLGIHGFRRNWLHGLNGSDRIVRRSKSRQYR